MHQDIPTENFWDSPDLLVQVGSHLYGCAVEGSDTDLRGFVVEPGPYLLGRAKFEQYEDKVSDTVVWGLQKFFKQLTKGSPNTVEILYVPEDMIRTCTDVGRLVIERRDIFIGLNQLAPIRGFAHSEWLKAQLKHRDKQTGEIRTSSRVVGARRKADMQRFGYSVKNAYHAVRLLNEGLELVANGHITFPRPEADLLRSIRAGEIPFERVEAEYERADRALAAAIEGSSLREQPDIKAINSLYYEIVTDPIMRFLETRDAHTVS